MGHRAGTTAIVGIKITEEDDFDFFGGETDGVPNAEYFELGGPFDAVEFGREYPVYMGTPLMQHHVPHMDGAPEHESISGEDLEAVKQRVREAVKEVPGIPDDTEIGFHVFVAVK